MKKGIIAILFAVSILNGCKKTESGIQSETLHSTEETSAVMTESFSESATEEKKEVKITGFDTGPYNAAYVLEGEELKPYKTYKKENGSVDEETALVSEQSGIDPYVTILRLNEDATVDMITNGTELDEIAEYSVNRNGVTIKNSEGTETNMYFYELDGKKYLAVDTEKAKILYEKL